MVVARLFASLALSLAQGAAVGLALLHAVPAQADDVLEGTPVVRRNSLYRAGRQEIGVVFGTSLGDPFVRNLVPGAHYDAHLTDWLSIGADLLVGIGVDTGMKAEITTKVGKHNETFDMQTSRLALLAGGHASVAPMSGKFMLLASLPLHWDLHVNLGAGVASTPGITASSGGKAPPTFSVAPWVGGGGRIFLSRVLAVTADLNSWFISRTLSVDRNNQPPGAAFAGQLVFTAGVSFFVPPDLRRAE
ncbi:MAG: hypothetical protein FJ100_15910 [Deltaproteobacteria bacterium]|nr:hypothetical protein [Deltaproteobacteria bacterium]